MWYVTYWLWWFEEKNNNCWQWIRTLQQNVSMYLLFSKTAIVDEQMCTHSLRVLSLLLWKGKTTIEKHNSMSDFSRFIHFYSQLRCTLTIINKANCYKTFCYWTDDNDINNDRKFNRACCLFTRQQAKTSLFKGTEYNFI